MSVFDLEPPPPPDQFAIETLAALRTTDDVLHAIVKETDSDHELGKRLADFGSLGRALVAGNLQEIIELRQRLHDALPEDRHVYVEYLCAAVGLKASAAEVAKAFSIATRHLTEWTRDHAWKANTDDQDRDARHVDERARLAASEALGWLLIATGERSPNLTANYVYDHARLFATNIDAAIWQSASFDGYRRATDLLKRKFQAIEDSWKRMKAAKAAAEAGVDFEIDESGDEKKGRDENASGILVLASVSSSESSGGKEATRAVRRIVGTKIPAVSASEGKLAEVRRTMAAEYPHAVSVVDILVRDVRPGEAIRLRPTVIVGEPGGGKSHMSRRLVDLLGIPSTLLDGATTSDQSIVGCPRRWAGGHPSMPLTLIEQHMTANPAIIIDELEKVGRSSAGSMHEALLSMLEKSTAARWRDQYVDAEIDISNVNWIFTANSLEGIPLPLRSRLRVVRMPLPGRDHIPILASHVLKSVLSDRGIDPVWEPPLDGIEIAAVVKACGKETSVRDIQKFVEGVLDARSQSAVRN